MKKVCERDIEKYLKSCVEAAGGEYRRLKWLGRRGAPDDFVMLNGGHFAECKAPEKPLSAHQEREHNRMRRRGIHVWLLDSCEDVENFVRWCLEQYV